MSSIIQKRPTSSSLPVSKTDTNDKALRRRLSSFSLNLQPISSSSPAAAWAFHRSKSVQSLTEYARKWWVWGTSWILSRKPMFAKDLEMNEEETAALGSHKKGSWSHVFFKVRSQIKKIVRSSDKVGLPQTCRYHSFNYSNKFDHSRTATLVY